MIYYNDLDDEDVEDDLEEELLANHQEKQEEKVDQVVEAELQEEQVDQGAEAEQLDQGVQESYEDDRPLDRPERREITEIYTEETAAEITPTAGAGIAGAREPVEESREEAGNEEDTKAAGKGVGVLGIAVSIVSLFFLPVIFSIAGIIFGAISAKQNHPGIGYTAIGIGAFSLIMSFFFAPFVS